MHKRTHNRKSTKEKRKELRNDMTPQEKILWSRLRRKQLGVKFRRQHGIGEYVVDFYCPQEKLVIEVDGSQHMKDDEKRHDRKRTAHLQKQGLTVLRFWNNEINNNVEGVILKIQSVLVGE